MKRRSVPFGYQVKLGKVVIEPCEAQIVKQIYALYLNGLSYQAIADQLTQRQIVFFAERYDWNKNRVKRLLENTSYLGEKGYDEIIDQDTFENVAKRITSKSVNKRKTPQEIGLLKNKMYCANCKLLLTRYISHGRDTWKCQNNGCIIKIRKHTVDVLLEQLQQVLITYVPSINEQKEDEVLQSESIKTLDENIKTLLMEDDINEKAITHLIYKRASTAFCLSDDGENELNLIKFNAVIQDIRNDEAFDFSRLVSILKKIYFIENEITCVETYYGEKINLKD